MALEMTLEELKEQKQLLEAQIYSALREFEARTGFWVQDIDLEVLGLPQKREFKSVRIKVTLL